MITHRLLYRHGVQTGMLIMTQVEHQDQKHAILVLMLNLGHYQRASTDKSEQHGASGNTGVPLERSL